MFRWLFGWLNHDSSSKLEEYQRGGAECPYEPGQVKVDVDLPDFLVEASVDTSVAPKKLDSSSNEHMSDNIPLLDNRQLVKVFSECADLLSEIDRISPRFKSSDSQLLMETINERIRSALYLSGGTAIEGETSFDPIRHTCPEKPLAKEGTPIIETIEAGVLLESRVFVKAKVRLKE